MSLTNTSDKQMPTGAYMFQALSVWFLRLSEGSQAELPYFWVQTRGLQLG